MIRGFLLLSIGASLFASSDYVPFSKFSKEKQVEYNFVKVEKKSNEKIQEVKKIKKTQIRNYKKPNEANLIKKTQLRKPVIQDTIKPKTNNIKSAQLEATKYKQNILYTAKLTYSPLNVEHSTTTTSSTNKSNSFEPSASINYGNHKLEGSYFKSESDASVADIDTTWYKLAYKYNYKNASAGIAANHLIIDKTVSQKKETFPSLEIDFKNSSEYLALQYGASIGKNSNIDYAYEYFFNVDIKPSIDSSASVVVGYKNRTVQFENNDEKFEFTGPYLGINTKF